MSEPEFDDGIVIQPQQGSGRSVRVEEHEDHPMMRGAPFIELGPTDREWSMIRLVDLQTAIAMGRRR